jgi:hypothetical protein
VTPHRKLNPGEVDRICPYKLLDFRFERRFDRRPEPPFSTASGEAECSAAISSSAHRSHACQ